MKKTKTILILTLLLSALMLAACSGRTYTASGWPSMTVNGEYAYLSFNNHVYAINLINGQEAWRFPEEPDSKIAFYAPPALTKDGQVIIGSYAGILYSLDANTGKLNWTFEESEDRFIAGALVTEKGIFAPSADHKLYALDFDGNLIWEPFVTNEPIWATPITDSNCECLYVASMDHIIYAIDVNTGKKLWDTGDLGGAIVSQPQIDSQNTLYTGTFGKELIAINLNTQAVKWRFETQDWVWASPLVTDSTIFFGDLSGTFYALNKENGTQLWQIKPGDSIVGKPLLINDNIYLTSEDGKLTSVTLDGNINWTNTIEGNLYEGPLFADGKILVANNQASNLVYALDENGNQIWIFQPEEK